MTQLPPAHLTHLRVTSSSSPAMVSTARSHQCLTGEFIGCARGHVRCTCNDAGCLQNSIPPSPQPCPSTHTRTRHGSYRFDGVLSDPGVKVCPSDEFCWIQQHARWGFWATGEGGNTFDAEVCVCIHQARFSACAASLRDPILCPHLCRCAPPSVGILMASTLNRKPP